ncbi:MAG: PBECR4 domain-containing protein [Clostridiales bacterium]|nr:PBECR4 domain-containing protein [Clostridiales bacterium]
MHNVYDCVEAFGKLLDKEYQLVLGRKNTVVNLQINFEKKECFHLMGLQYLTDRPELVHDRGKIFDAIMERRITAEHLQSSDLYYKIEDRVDMLPLLEDMIDNNDTIFKYNRKLNTYSVIKADYIMKNKMEERNLFLFLAESKKDGKYFCRSFFPQDKMDYTKNQASWTLLYKKKITLSTGEERILYDRLQRE